MSGIDVLHRLHADPMTRDIPVVVFSADAQHESCLAALQAGADDFLTKPIDDLTLLARLRSLLRGREGSEAGPRGAALQALGLAENGAAFEGPGLVALIADRPETALRWRKELAPAMADRFIMMSREEALVDEGSGPSPDVFVIEADLGHSGDGLRLMSELRSRPASRHAAICIVRSEASTDSAAMAFDLGANDVVCAAFDAFEMGLRLRTLLRRKRRADRTRASVNHGLRLAVMDPLTGLYNRRYAIPHLAAMAEQAHTAGAALAVMVVDLDRFKAVNDRWGHSAGDAVLIEVARRLAANLRPHDLLARIGGEEFLVGMAATPLPEARATAEQLCQAVQERPIQLPAGGSLSVTISIGLAISEPGQPLRLEPVAAVVDRADRALLVAKSEGRNQVTISRTAA